ncbi:transmembrane amino acid transporter protein-domain-containing protein [Halteromyces radiatus]|uniref:transmembrane amino acid transporter protein-domain-containing protein n=1 Tax=Halteromyces radiatus TaxID=101107 RepID=UPI00221F29D1|nr:transmembrane amino acid transporter protein-domain-containing protein [Halteromyces radiatus]KAI8081540.1 transmembrane amino acid transporter protein-domain-containing protein [Halteromyces radiatus]
MTTSDDDDLSSTPADHSSKKKKITLESEQSSSATSCREHLTIPLASKKNHHTNNKWPQERPSLLSTKSFTHSVSSYSLYNCHFASERWDHHHHHHHHRRHHSELKLSSNKKNNTIENNKEKIDQVDDPSINDTNHPTSSAKKAMFMFLKAFIGSGVLFLPKGFENGGLALSIALMVLIASICLFSFLRLVKTQQVIGGSYGDMGHRLYGQGVRYTVLFFIIISQVGFVCSYFIFISGNLVSVMHVLSQCSVLIPQASYIWMPLLIVIPLILVRHIAKLSLAVILADMFIVFGLICVLYFTSSQLIHHGVGKHIQAVNPSNFALMIGTATFSFEGIGLVIPIAESMEQPDKFPLVVSLGTIIICVIYILVGSMSYLAYGDQIQAAVVYNFPPASGLTITVQLLYSIAIVLSIPLMLFPAIKIIENGVFQKCPSGSQDIRIRWLKNIFRCVLTTGCATMAYLIGGDNLDKFVAFGNWINCLHTIVLHFSRDLPY